MLLFTPVRLTQGFHSQIALFEENCLTKVCTTEESLVALKLASLMVNNKLFNNCINLILLSNLKFKYLRIISQNKVFLKQTVGFSNKLFY